MKMIVTGMHGNPHFPAAGNMPTDSAIAAGTLAHAYEQRTANLIAERNALYLIAEDGRGDGWYALLDNLEGQINARLGITS